MTSSARVSAIALLLAGCGGVTEVNGSGGTGAAGSGGGSGSGGLGGGAGTAGDAGLGGDAGWTECGTPDWQACGTPQCPAERPNCGMCLPAIEPDLLSVCAASIEPLEVPGKPRDGTIRFTVSPEFDTFDYGIQAPFSAGIFLAAHGEADRVAYADFGTWTGEALPMPTNCPSVSGTEICGGFCGGCPVGQICTGRSPLHPYGLCVPEQANPCSINPSAPQPPCPKGEKCFAYKVDAARQPIADAFGYCLTSALCAASAANLPGGGKCE